MTDNNSQNYLDVFYYSYYIPSNYFSANIFNVQTDYNVINLRQSHHDVGLTLSEHAELEEQGDVVQLHGLLGSAHAPLAGG